MPQRGDEARGEEKKEMSNITELKHTEANVDNVDNDADAQESANGPMQFDFWLGEWDLTWGENRKGTNSITKILDGCVVLEQFDATLTAPFRGLSLSVYDAQSGEWQQTWVDNTYGYLVFRGRFSDGIMELRRTAHEHGRPFLQRMLWYNIAPDSLDWNWERSDDDGRTWQTLWSIHYRRKAPI